MTEEGAKAYNLSISVKGSAPVMSERVFNFAAGPATMPESVLSTARSELMNWHGSGMSVMEMTHRGPEFGEIFSHAKQMFISLLNVPDTHEVLFLQGGATTQFASVPLNLMGEEGRADYAVTGNFSGIAAKEAQKYGRVRLAADAGPDYRRIPGQDELTLTPDASYFHYCANNTVFGTAWSYVPQTGSVPLVCDMSSEIMSKPVDVSKFGLIYAGAQKNIAPAGLTVVIIDRALLGREAQDIPKIMSYALMVDKDSMLNTPPCWCIYMLGLVLDWIEEQGGVAEMARRKAARSAMLYDVLDSSDFYLPHAEASSRSDMNVTFRTPSKELDAEFVKCARQRGMLNLAGHKLTGGIRASVYNAMSMEGVEALAGYMKEFEESHV